MTTRARLICIYVGLFAIVVVIGIPVLFGRENDLEGARILDIPIWYGLFPFIVIGFLYLGYVARPRWEQEGRMEPINDRPAYSPVIVVFCVIVLAAFISVSVRSDLVLAMDLLNESPFRVVSEIEKVIIGRFGSKTIRVVYKTDAITFYPGRGWFRPLKATAPLEKGQKLVLVGRQSWAGIVVDEIKPYSGDLRVGTVLNNGDDTQ
ncbi:MAG: hypothetical protein HY914_09080 [Desulfomonile tiedjei]|nr:hypothetical protein [Desulfomonile tiedjei]